LGQNQALFRKSLTNQYLKDFNANTWGWNGFSNVWLIALFASAKALKGQGLGLVMFVVSFGASVPGF
jgi:hypothetical protein